MNRILPPVFPTAHQQKRFGVCGFGILGSVIL